MTRADLKASTRKELAQMAKQHRVAGWHAMRKEQLVDALARVIRRDKAKEARRANARAKTNGGSNGARRKFARGSSDTATQKQNPAQSGYKGEARPHRLVPFVSNDPKNGTSSHRDTLVAEVRDSHWIHVRWRLTQRILERAEAALGVEWHQAVPVIRVFDVTDGEATLGTKSWVNDVEIHTDTDNWYVPVADSPRSYKLQIGYRAPSGKFFTMARSRKMTTPRPNKLPSRNQAAFSPDTNGAESSRNTNSAIAAEIAEAVRAQHRQRDVTAEVAPRGGRNAATAVEFQMDADVSIRGVAPPQAELTLLGERVETAADGTFRVQFALAEGRQVIPAVMLSPDGNEQRTIVLAIERNTKHLEPRSMDEML